MSGRGYRPRLASERRDDAEEAEISPATDV